MENEAGAGGFPKPPEIGAEALLFASQIVDSATNLQKEQESSPTFNETSQQHARLGVLSWSTQERSFASLFQLSTFSSLSVRNATAPAMLVLLLLCILLWST